MRRVAVFTLVLGLALALLWRGIELYQAHLAHLSRSPTHAELGPVPPAPAVASSRAAPSEPTPSELEALQAADPIAREQACWTLRERSVTDAYRTAVEQAASRPENQGLQHLFTCLRARYPEREAFEALLEQLPKQEGGYRAYGPGLACRLRVLGERASEDPRRVRDLLLLAAISPNFSIRKVALDGLERIDLPEIPGWLAEKARSDPSGHRRLFALDAAVALGAGDMDMPLLEHALADEYEAVRHAATRALVASSRSDAARLIARRLLDEPESRERLGVFRARESSRHDASAALAEVALDEAAPLERRQSALAILGRQGDPGAAALVEPLARSAAEPLRSYAVAAIEQLGSGGRRADGLRPLEP